MTSQAQISPNLQKTILFSEMFGQTPVNPNAPVRAGYFTPKNILASEMFGQTPASYSYDPLNVNKPKQVVSNPYTYSANLTQGVIAAIIADLGSNYRLDHSILIGFLVLLSSAVPPSGIFGIWGPNEKLNETLIATLIGGAILKAVAGGNYLKKAGTMLIIDAASMGLTDAFYTAFILGGKNEQYNSYRGLYPEGNLANKVFLG